MQTKHLCLLHITFFLRDELETLQCSMKYEVTKPDGEKEFEIDIP